VARVLLDRVVRSPAGGDGRAVAPGAGVRDVDSFNGDMEMDSFFSMIKFFFGCGTLLVLAMFVLAHLPKSPLRTMLVQISGWATAALCGAYIAAPVDLLPEILVPPPFGFLDDLIALIFGIMSARSAMNAGKEEPPAHEQKRNAA